MNPALVLRRCIDEPLQVGAVDFGTLLRSIPAGEVKVEVNNHGELRLSGSASHVTGEVMDFSTADLADLDVGGLDIDTDTFSTLTG